MVTLKIIGIIVCGLFLLLGAMLIANKILNKCISIIEKIHKGVPKEEFESEITYLSFWLGIILIGCLIH